MSGALLDATEEVRAHGQVVVASAR
jgi:hypothetical protein